MSSRWSLAAHAHKLSVLKEVIVGRSEIKQLCGHERGHHRLETIRCSNFYYLGRAEA